ncbi:AAA family ATPase [Pontiella sulfatireligans]|uniref:ATPase AAA-3 domain-containing protein n=1 Tax=Pontiella sulfatireligans TaxID=2750658 RepID=A0A6C2UH08_9BACT|nr:MoxR family ATPase [Pontiella sulfatireligans]VGO18797.1 hypothetical protein SCARR_00850 [Pontiella sulfatireligans]
MKDTRLFERLGIHGWSLADENLALASLLTGDPLLMVGAHGAAKTHAAAKVAQALGVRFMAYDASKALFEDVLGFPNVESLKQGKVEYVQSAVTVWDKEFVLIDEINRAVPELQAKWLEIIRSRKIMGFETEVNWVWSAMNPLQSRYNGTQQMDAALIGRYATFLYPPEALDMDEDDRIKVLRHINGDDAPSIGVWNPEAKIKTVDAEETVEVGYQIKVLLARAARFFQSLKADLSTLGEFLSRLAVLVMKETDGEVKLDGRRLGFIYRNLLANRSVELAREALLGEAAPAFSKSAKCVILSSIPMGLNDEGINREELLHQMEVCIDLLADYFADGGTFGRVETIYRLFTTTDLFEKAEILLGSDLSEMVKLKAWNDLCDTAENITPLAYIALRIESAHPGRIPTELLEKVGGRIDLQCLESDSIRGLTGENIERLDELETLFTQPDDLRRIIAFQEARILAVRAALSSADIKSAACRIMSTAHRIEALMKGETHETVWSENPAGAGHEDSGVLAA